MQQSRVIPRPRSFACDLATLCAPTLAGLKPASLFRIQPEDEADFVDQFQACRQELEGHGLVLTLLKGCRKTGAYLVYLYRKAELEALLGQAEHADFIRWRT